MLDSHQVEGQRCASGRSKAQRSKLARRALLLKGGSWRGSELTVPPIPFADFSRVSDCALHQSSAIWSHSQRGFAILLISLQSSQAEQAASLQRPCWAATICAGHDRSFTSPS